MFPFLGLLIFSYQVPVFSRLDSRFTGFSYIFSGICWSRVCQWTIYLYLFWYSNISKCHLCIRCCAYLFCTYCQHSPHCVHSGPTFTLYKPRNGSICHLWDLVHDANPHIGSTEPSALIWNCWCRNLPIVYHTARNSDPAGWLLILLQKHVTTRTCRSSSFQVYPPYPEKCTFKTLFHVYLSVISEIWGS